MNGCRNCRIELSQFVIIFLSIIAGIAVGFLFYSLSFVLIKVIIAIGLALAVIFLIVLAVKTFVIPSDMTNIQYNCLCVNFGILLFGIIATVIISLAAIVSTLTTADIYSAIIVGLWAFSFILTLGSFAELLLCVKNSECGCD